MDPQALTVEEDTFENSSIDMASETQIHQEHSRVAESFRCAFQALDCDNVTNQHINELATIICVAMSSENRVYHAVNHVFDLFVSAEKQPVSCLAAMFHDVVYLQIDDGIHPIVMEKLASAGLMLESIDRGTCNEPKPSYRLAQPHSVVVKLCLSVFGRDGTAVMTTGEQGVNEFLSALLAVQCLHQLVPPYALVEIVVCIEATIPFRDTTAFSKLLQRTIDSLHLFPSLQGTYSLRQAKSAVETACLLAERDVGNFAAIDTRWFLTNSWKLLPEIHHSLRDPVGFTFADYAKAMQANVRFYKFLKSNPTRVFHQFEACRTLEEYQRLISLTVRNLNIGIEYGRTKFIVSCVLDALARIHDLSDHSATWFMKHVGCGIDVLAYGRQSVILPSQPRQNGKISSRRGSLDAYLSTSERMLQRTRLQNGFQSPSRKQLSHRQQRDFINDLNSNRTSNTNNHTPSSLSRCGFSSERESVSDSGEDFEAGSSRSSSIQLAPCPTVRGRRSTIHVIQSDRNTFSLSPFTLAVNAPRSESTSSLTQIARRKSSLPSAEAMRRRSILPPVDDQFFCNLLIPSYDYVEALLEFGVGYKALFDVDIDSTSSYVHQALISEEGVREASHLCDEYLEQKVDPEEFIETFDRRVTTLLSHCISLYSRSPDTLHCVSESQAEGFAEDDITSGDSNTWNANRNCNSSTALYQQHHAEAC
eukprot:gene2172-5193_t